MWFVVSRHVVLLAKCFATFRTLVLLHSRVRDQVLIQLRRRFKFERTFRALLVPYFGVCGLQVHSQWWLMNKGFLAFITFEKLLVGLCKENVRIIFGWLSVNFNFVETLTWIRMCSIKLALCFKMVPQTTHLYWFSCCATCSDRDSAEFSITPHIWHRNVVSPSLGGTSVRLGSASSFDPCSISWSWRACIRNSIWLTNTCWQTPHFFGVW